MYEVACVKSVQLGKLKITENFKIDKIDRWEQLILRHWKITVSILQVMTPLSSAQTEPQIDIKGLRCIHSLLQCNYAVTLPMMYRLLIHRSSTHHTEPQLHFLAVLQCSSWYRSGNTITTTANYCKADALDYEQTFRPLQSLYPVDLEVWSKLAQRARIKRTELKFARDFDCNRQRVRAFPHALL